MKKLWTIFAAVMLCVSLAFAQGSESPGEQAQTPEEPALEAPRCEMVGEIEVRTFPAVTVAAVMEKASDYAPEGGYAEGEAGMMLAYTNMMTAGFEKLTAWINAGGKPMGPPLALYFEDPEKTPADNLTCKIAFPTADEATADAPVVIEKMPEYTAVTCTYKGPYEGSGEIWRTCDLWMKDQGFVPAGAPMEVYLRSQEDKVPPAEFLTEIRMPVTKAEAKPEEGGK